MAIELEDTGGAVEPPVGAISVLLPAGYGDGVLTGSMAVSEVDSSGLAIELDEVGGAVGPPVGTISVLLPAG